VFPETHQQKDGNASQTSESEEITGRRAFGGIVSKNQQRKVVFPVRFVVFRQFTQHPSQSTVEPLCRRIAHRVVRCRGSLAYKLAEFLNHPGLKVSALIPMRLLRERIVKDEIIEQSFGCS